MAVEHQPMTIRVHHLENSRSQRILWLLEELELPYEITRYERDPATMRAPPALRQVHPLGRSPVIEDGSLVLMETGAIVEYLVERSEEHTSELQSLMRTSYAVFCLKKKTTQIYKYYNIFRQIT